LGVHATDVLGRFCGDVLHPQGANGVRPCAEHCPIVHARFRGGARATEHLRINGQRRTVVITSAPAADNGQQGQVLRDETDVEAVRRVRDAVLANVSHEFRTPLSAQLASIELLLDQLPDLSVDQTGDLVRALQRGTLRLTQLIDNLLESARLEAGHLTIRQRPVALDAVVEDALELMRPLLDQRAQQVVVDLPYPLPSLCGDPPRLTQVFVNLLANATKFSPAHSTIQIGGTVDAAGVTLWVEDEGPGLPSSNGAPLFGQFVRAHANEPEQGGVGLGLWIVQSIMERHGGTVDARSIARGTRVCVTLPVEDTPPTPSTTYL
jgi:signal transduction histidine kinase